MFARRRVGAQNRVYVIIVMRGARACDDEYDEYNDDYAYAEYNEYDE